MQVLQITGESPETVRLETVRDHFRKLAMIHHPDKCQPHDGESPHDFEKRRKWAEETMKNLNEYHSLLQTYIEKRGESEWQKIMQKLRDMWEKMRGGKSFIPWCLKE